MGSGQYELMAIFMKFNYRKLTNSFANNPKNFVEILNLKIFKKKSFFFLYTEHENDHDEIIYGINYLTVFLPKKSFIRLCMFKLEMPHIDIHQGSAGEKIITFC